MLSPFTRFLAALSTTLLATHVLAQSTTQSLTIGGGGARGCQGNEDPPRLSNGTLASATLDFGYDARTHVLDLVVANTSPVTSGTPNPLLTHLAFNLPHDAVTAVDLLSQTGAGGASPDFDADFDSDVFHRPDLSVACMGNFGLLLTLDDGSGIGNPQADRWDAPPGSVTIGPVTFRFRLRGPGVDSLTAEAIALGFSRLASAHQVNAVCKFQRGGRHGEGSGFISSTVANAGCRPTGWLTARPRIGTTFGICLNGEPSCAGCFVGSLTPGPTQFGSLTIPLGLPLLFDVFLPPLPRNSIVCLPVDVPPDPLLVGQTIYVAWATPQVTLDDLVAFSPRINITFVD